MKDQISQLTDTINKANGVGQDAVTANADYEKTLSDADEAVKEYTKDHGKSAAALDESTAAGSANASMLADLAKNGQDAAKAQFDLDGNTDTYVQRLQQTRQDVLQRAEDLGATVDQAQSIADKVAAIPTEKEISILADTSYAAQTIDDFMAKYGQLAGTIMYRSNLPDLNGSQSGTGRMGTSANGNLYAAGRALAFASGGFPTGVYSGGAPIYKFAEPETRWEAFISGRVGQENRNRAILAEAGRRLGVSVGAPARDGGSFAGGGSNSTSVPVNIKVEGVANLALAAEMAGNSVAMRARQILRSK